MWCLFLLSILVHWHTVFRQVGRHNWVVDKKLNLSCKINFRFKEFLVLKYLLRLLLNFVAVFNLGQWILICHYLLLMSVLMAKHPGITWQLAVFVQVKIRNVPCVPLIFFNQSVYNIPSECRLSKEPGISIVL